MKIAVLGWGSLIWCPGSLRIKTRWRSDGPNLPIEFARISRDGRLTLVILPGAENQQTYWALSEFESVADARRNLRAREGAGLQDIHWLTADGHAASNVPGLVIESVRIWLAAQEQIGGAIWTGLGTNWPDKRRCDFAPEDAVRYLKELESDRDRVMSIFDRAQEYVKNTPPLIQTEVRRAMQQQGWRDSEVSSMLFDE